MAGWRMAYGSKRSPPMQNSTPRPDVKQHHRGVKHIRRRPRIEIDRRQRQCANESKASFFIVFR